MVHGKASGNGGGSTRSGWIVLWHDERRGLGESQRRWEMGMSCPASATYLFSGNCRAEEMKVFIPTPLRSYTGKEGVIEATGGTIGELLMDLNRRFPGFRFRIIDEQDGIREHIKI